MQFSVGVEYALHCLLYLIMVPKEKSVGIKDLATYQSVSVSYLSKVFTKLRKAGVVKSIPGVYGGYGLARAAESITFLDILVIRMPVNFKRIMNKIFSTNKERY